MKKLTYISSFCMMIILIVSSCTQQPTPPPSTPSVPTTNPNTTSMNNGEQALKGKWFLKRVNFNSIITNYNDPTKYCIFDSTIYTDSGPIPRTGYRYYNYNGALAGQNTWKCNTAGDTLIFQSTVGASSDPKYRIVLVTSDSLIVENSQSSGGVVIFHHFHR